MSKIRNKVLASQPAIGTVQDLGEWVLESIKKMSPAEKAEVRAELERKTTNVKK